MLAETCESCGNTVHESERLVLARGEVRRVYCSEPCLQAGVRDLRGRQRAAGGRLAAVVLAIGLVLGGAAFLRYRPRAEHPRSIVSGQPPAVEETEPVGPKPFGPPWPPTDADWTAEFAKASWVYPLPGPVRRVAVSDGRMLGPEPPREHPSACRTENACGVDLGGDLWGEHVYAAHDGVVDRLHRSSEERGGVYVRLSHWGGMVFTQYLHLAAIPRRLYPGVHVKAGDVIGLVGDTGVRGSARHLHFTLSVRPSSEFSEVYWDPEPLMGKWPLRQPAHGTVAGLVSLAGPAEHQAGTPLARKRSRARPRKKEAPAAETTPGESGSAPD